MGRVEGGKEKIFDPDKLSFSAAAAAAAAIVQFSRCRCCVFLFRAAPRRTARLNFRSVYFNFFC